MQGKAKKQGLIWLDWRVVLVGLFYHHDPCGLFDIIKIETFELAY
jgi:hypothetical protein